MAFFKRFRRPIQAAQSAHFSDSVPTLLERLESRCLLSAALDQAAILPELQACSAPQVEAVARANPVAKPTVKIEVDSQYGSPVEGEIGLLRITRTADSYADPLTVYFTRSGTATFGSNKDYKLQGADVYEIWPVSVKIPAGQTTTGIYLYALEDELGEPDETVVITLSPASSYTLDPVIAHRSATATIVDNEPTVKIERLSNTSEGESSGNIRVTRTGSTMKDLKVNFSHTGTATYDHDYRLVTHNNNTMFLDQSVTILAGHSYETIELAALDDQVVEPQENVTLSLSSAAWYKLDADASKRTITATISDNEPTVSITSLGNTSEGGTDSIFRVSRSNVSNYYPLKVEFTRSGSATFEWDYKLAWYHDALTYLDHSVTIPAGQGWVDISLGAMDDQVVESTENVTLTLKSSTQYRLGTSNLSATATISDNEPTVSITSLGNTSEGGTDSIFRVSRSNGSNFYALKVEFTRSGSATFEWDYKLAWYHNALTYLDHSVTIPAGQGWVDISLGAMDDQVVESTENVILTLKSSTAYRLNNDPTKLTASATIADNEPTVKIERVTDAAEGGTHGLFRVTRFNGSTFYALPVNFTRTGSASLNWDFKLTFVGGIIPLASNSITIPSGQDSVLIEVPAIDDDQAESPENVTLTLSNSTGYRLSAGNTVAAMTVSDNESTVTITRLGDATEGGSDGSFRVSRASGTLLNALTVNFSRSGTAYFGSDYRLATGINDIVPITSSVTIPVGLPWVDFKLKAIDDDAVESSDTVQLTLSTSSHYRLGSSNKSATATINDNEPTVKIQRLASPAEGSLSGLFRVTRYGGSMTSVLVVSFTRSGTATYGSNYDYTLTGFGVFEAWATSVTLAAGVEYVDITIKPVNDTKHEGPETVILTLNTSTHYRLDTLADYRSASATITDND